MFKKYSDPFYPKTKHSHNDLTAFLHFTMMNLLLKTLGQLHSACSASEVGGKSQAGKRHNVQLNFLYKSNWAGLYIKVENLDEP